MSTTAPFGTWPSPITPGTITTRTVLLSQVRVDGADTYWVGVHRSHLKWRSWRVKRARTLRDGT